MALIFKSGLSNIQLDIVGFLAILGEASVQAHAQVAFLSKWSYLPRLIPAPQALIRAERPERLAPSLGRKVVGTKSGNIRENLNHIANLLHEDGDLKEHEVRVIAVEESAGDVPVVKAKQLSPVTALAVLGSLMSAGLLVFSVVKHDGYSTIATILLSCLSTLIGIGSKWHLEFSKRDPNKKAPKSDVVIVYPHGAFLVVKCREDTRRRLYWAPEKCIYNVNNEIYRFLSLIGTLMLMGGVITLANSTNELQLAWAVAYMILNAAYWVVAALPNRYNWDLSNFVHWPVETTIRDMSHEPDHPIQKSEFLSSTRYRTPSQLLQLKAGKTKPKGDAQSKAKKVDGNFTQTLWEAIAYTKSSGWARMINIAPQTGTWDKWLEEAEERAKKTRITEELKIPEKPSRIGKKLIVTKIEAPKWDAKKGYDDILLKDSRDNPDLTELEDPEPLGIEEV